MTIHSCYLKNITMELCQYGEGEKGDLHGY